MKRSLAQAVATALVLVALLIGSYLLGRPAFFVLVCAVVLLALYEAFAALSKSGRSPVAPFGLACGLALMIASYLEDSKLFLLLLGITVAGSLVLALRPARGETPVVDAAFTTLVVGWIAGGGSAAVAILRLPGGRLLLIAFVIVVVLSDIGAYFVGTDIGRHKIAPSISPAKSWEGFVAGLVCGLIGGLLVAGVLFKISIPEGLALGTLCAVVGPMGDLVESLFKRELGIKDSGRLLPGHGGMLDRLDAIVLSAPPALLLLRHAAEPVLTGGIQPL
jgi:phosphatidate cytidylyltransferase